MHGLFAAGNQMAPRPRLTIAALLAIFAMTALASCQSSNARASHAADRVLLVCNASTRPCPRVPHYRTLQSAVDAARPGDWIILWPGVYHEDNPAHRAGVWIT